MHRDPPPATNRVSKAMKEIADSKDWRGEAGRLVNAMARYFDDPTEQNKRVALAAIRYCKDLGL